MTSDRQGRHMLCACTEVLTGVNTGILSIIGSVHNISYENGKDVLEVSYDAQTNYQRFFKA